MPNTDSQTKVRLGPQGRLVIPAKLRQMLCVEPGDNLLARVDDGQLILEKAETVKRRLKARFAGIPKGKSLAAELLMERREEAKRDRIA
jgi:AbrB family looped-hinge helix DNA binding protein